MDWFQDLPDWLVAVGALVTAVVWLLSVGIKVAALGVIPDNRKPSTGVAWLLMVLLAPIFGLIAFLFFGSPRVGRERHEKQLRVNDRLRTRLQELPDSGPLVGPPYLASVVTLNRSLGALPLTPANTVLLIEDYQGSIEAMAREVRAAREFVHVEFYICAWDDMTSVLFDAMADAAARGVTVRFLFDHLGSKGLPTYKDMVRRLDETDIEWHPMLPVKVFRGEYKRPDLRNHRKLIVVDGEVGFMGSQNLTEPGYNKPKNHKLDRAWVELMARVEGPVVNCLEAVFASDWYAETDEVLATSKLREGTRVSDGEDQVTGVPAQLVPSGPGFVSENNLRLFTTLLYSAQHRISLTSPYFVPDESLLYAVTTAAQRGIDIELFVSEQSDQFMVGHAQASYYRALLESGVRIYLYPAPFILHSKHFTIDDDVAVIGSSNMDMRSFALNYELSMLMLGSEVVARMRKVEDRYRELSRELTLEEWSQRRPRTRYVDNVMRLTAALQ